MSDDISRRSGMPHKSLSSDALELLADYAWPGNIRELRNVLEQASLMTDDLQLTAAHLRGAGVVGSVAAAGVPAAEAPRTEPQPGAAKADTPPPATAVPAIGTIKSLPQAIAELEVQAIRDALAATGGNKLAASRLLGISRATLYEKLPMLERHAAA